MSVNETPVLSSLLMDRDTPLANYSQPDGRRALAVATANAAVPADYDNGTVTRPNPTTEIYKFYKGASLLRTVTLVYTTASKQDLSSWSIA